MSKRPQLSIGSKLEAELLVEEPDLVMSEERDDIDDGETAETSDFLIGESFADESNSVLSDYVDAEPANRLLAKNS